jgi:hypothetical protein
MVDIARARAGVVSGVGEVGSGMVIGTLASFSARRAHPGAAVETKKAARSRLRVRSRIRRLCPVAPVFGAETRYSPPLGRAILISHCAVHDQLESAGYRRKS